MITKELSLKTNISRLLSIELGGFGAVTCPGEHVTVIISLTDCENKFGDILQKIHRVIDDSYPDRDENLFILVRDETGSFQNVMKVWKTY
jgi:hypothetical protein